MRRRVIASLPADQAGRELKLGPGGLRDIVFAVQLLQLVHGDQDRRCRLRGGGDAGRAGAALAAAWLRRQAGRGQPGHSAYLVPVRVVEHPLQLRQLRRTHTLPEDPAVLRLLGRALRQMRYASDDPAG